MMFKEQKYLKGFSRLNSLSSLEELLEIVSGSGNSHKTIISCKARAENSFSTSTLLQLLARIKFSHFKNKKIFCAKG